MLTGEMNSSLKNDVKIMGEGSSSGGAFRNIRIMGQGRMNGDTSSVKFKSMGEASVHGHLDTSSFKSMGEISIDGGLNADKTALLGTIRVNGKMQVRKLKALGHTEVRGDVRGELLKVTGGLTIHEGDCTAERLLIRGTFNTEGALNAEHIGIKLYGPCNASEIGGSEVRIHRSLGSWLSYMFLRKEKQSMTADVIEGDDVYLEHVEARIVRGRNVVIGRGCKIGTVEYSRKYKEHPSAIVEQSVRI
ncbi:hypothetical protein M3231_27235 [Neobacillus mesonae]|nr:hypothetical protein [Neobacillus mesonae]